MDICYEKALYKKATHNKSLHWILTPLHSAKPVSSVDKRRCAPLIGPRGKKEDLMTQWIIAVASAATALSVFLLWKQLKADHERSRRERALDLMRFFTDNINQAPLGLRYATQLVRHLDEKQWKNGVRS